MKNIQAVINANTYDFHSYKENQFLLFSDKILKTGPMKEYKEALKGLESPEVTDAGGGLVIPGLVLAHTHIYSTFARGMALPFNPKNFLQILEQLWWKMDRAQDREMIYSAGQMSAIGYIRHGVTTVIDHHASGKEIRGTLDMLKKAVTGDFGLRGMFCFETSDRFDIDQCIEENLHFASSPLEGRWAGHFGMHASMTLSDQSLKKIGDRIGGLPIHIHAAESEMDQQDCQEKYGISVIERLDRFGLLNPDSLIVHGAYLSDQEMDLIRERKCYLVINPGSNMNNGVGLPDYRRMKERGVPLMIGNDGMSTAIANEWQSLLFGMHHRYRDPLGFGLDDLWQIIQNSYDYTGRRLNTRLGRLEEGYAADLMILDEEPITPISGDNALGHLFFGYAMSLKPSHLWAGGELKLQNYKVKGATEEMYRRSRELSAKLWKEIS